MGKLIGFACIVGAVLSLFFYTKLETIIIIIELVGLVCCVLQLIRNLMGEGFLVTILIIFCCAVAAVLLSFGAMFIRSNLPDEAYGTFLICAFAAIHSIYNSIQWKS